jgi:hypothetical protein
MIEDMAMRALAPGAQAIYVSAVAKVARHFARAPDKGSAPGPARSPPGSTAKKKRYLIATSWLDAKRNG